MKANQTELMKAGVLTGSSTGDSNEIINRGVTEITTLITTLITTTDFISEGKISVSSRKFVFGNIIKIRAAKTLTLIRFSAKHKIYIYIKTTETICAISLEVS